MQRRGEHGLVPLWGGGQADVHCGGGVARGGGGTGEGVLSEGGGASMNGRGRGRGLVVAQQESEGRSGKRMLGK